VEFIKSNTVTQFGIKHHDRVGKDDIGVRGEAREWTLQIPTTSGFDDLRESIVPIGMYTVKLWQQAGGSRRRDRPTLLIAAPERNAHCSWIANRYKERLETRKGDTIDPALLVIRQDLALLNGLCAPLAQRQPRSLHSKVRPRVRQFNADFNAWEDGCRPDMPDPRLAGSNTSPGDYLRQVYHGQEVLAAMDADFVLQLVSSTACYAAQAALSPDPEPAITSGVYPARKIPYGSALIYELSDQPPRQLTPAPIKLAELAVAHNFSLDYSMAHLSPFPDEPFVL